MEFSVLYFILEIISIKLQLPSQLLTYNYTNETNNPKLNLNPINMPHWIPKPIFILYIYPITFYIGPTTLVYDIALLIVTVRFTIKFHSNVHVDHERVERRSMDFGYRWDGHLIQSVTPKAKGARIGLNIYIYMMV